VGKSTLFNRIIGRHAALVDKTAGVTRDRHYGVAEWLGRPFRLVDTGGIMPPEASRLLEAVRDQTLQAVAEADVVLFVLDSREEITAADQDIALQLHKAGKTVLLVGNKAERATAWVEMTPLHRLGFGAPHWISAEHGQGVGDLLDAVLMLLPSDSDPEAASTGVTVAIVGRPNVGKSSLVNHILREDRLLVDDAPGTTRDAIDTQVRINSRPYTLVDTAGMRKPRRIGAVLEKATVAVALKRIQRCEAAVLMLDATTEVGEQDVRIASYIELQGKACVIVINKWDVIDKTSRTYDASIRAMREAMPFMSHAPVITISALSGLRVVKLFPLIDAVVEASRRRIPTAALNECIKAVTRQHPPPAFRGKFVKFSFAVQTAVQPPTFLCFVNYPQGIKGYYQRYLENQLRQHFSFAGTPIRLHLRDK
jgi:GTP-binding protein